MKAGNLLIGIVSVSLMLPLTLSSQTKDSKSKDAIAPPPLLKEQVKFQPLNVKTGLWEKTATYKTAGHLPVPAGMLDKLTPDQRARFEARMNASSAGNTRTTTERSCLTAQQLNDPADLADKGCSVTVTESTSSKATGSVACRIQGIEMNGSAEFDAIDQEHVKGTEHVTSTGNGNTMTTDVTFTSKWLGSSCGGAQ
ncbi:MAG TPA: DUF3617 family protein [Terracidiphilus sp.]|jgi:hypothetical protein